MRTFIILRVATLFCFGMSTAFADIKYEECAASKFGLYDIFPTLDGGMLPSRFESDDYRIAPFASGECEQSTIYLKGHRLARVKPLTTEIVDLDAGTVTTINREKRSVTVQSFEDYRQHIRKSLAGGIRLSLRFSDLDDTVDGVSGPEPTGHLITATALSGVNKNHLAVRAEYWMVATLPFEEMTEFFQQCSRKYGPDDAGVCSFGSAEGFGSLDSSARTLPGYPVLRIVESTVPVPMGGNVVGATRVFRTVSKLSDFKSEPVDDGTFAIPSHFRVQVKHR